MEISSGYRETWVKANALVSLRLTPIPRVLIEISNAPMTLCGNLYNTGKLSIIRRPHGPGIEVAHDTGSIGREIFQPLDTDSTTRHVDEDGCEFTHCWIRHCQFSQLGPMRPACCAASGFLARRY